MGEKNTGICPGLCINNACHDRTQYFRSFPVFDLRNEGVISAFICAGIMQLSNGISEETYQGEWRLLAFMFSDEEADE
jgi:hypothetical protein